MTQAHISPILTPYNSQLPHSKFIHCLNILPQPAKDVCLLAPIFIRRMYVYLRPFSSYQEINLVIAATSLGILISGTTTPMNPTPFKMPTQWPHTSFYHLCTLLPVTQQKPNYFTFAETSAWISLSTFHFQWSF